MSTRAAFIADASADLRCFEPKAGASHAIDFEPVAFVERERALIAELAVSPSASLADAVAKAGELASLLAVGGYLDDLMLRLGGALAADLTALSSRAPVLGPSLPPAAPYPASHPAAVLGRG